MACGAQISNIIHLKTSTVESYLKNDDPPSQDSFDQSKTGAIFYMNGNEAHILARMIGKAWSIHLIVFTSSLSHVPASPPCLYTVESSSRKKLPTKSVSDVAVIAEERH